MEEHLAYEEDFKHAGVVLYRSVPVIRMGLPIVKEIADNSMEIYGIYPGKEGAPYPVLPCRGISKL